MIPDDSGVPGPSTLRDINATPVLDVSATPGLPTLSDDASATPAPVLEDLALRLPILSDDINVTPAPGLHDSGSPELLTLSDYITVSPAPELDDSATHGLLTLSDDINTTAAEALDDSGASGSNILSDDINETTSDTDVDEATVPVGDMTVVSFAHQPEPFSSGQCVHDACLQHKKENAEFLLMLTEGKQVSQVALDAIVKGCRQICKQTVSQTKERVLSVLNQAGVNVTDILGLEETLCCPQDPFESIDTPYLREKFYKKHFNYMVRMKYTCMIDIPVSSCSSLALFCQK